MTIISDPVRFERTLAAFDAANTQDPRADQDEQGSPVPYELLYARRMSTALAGFCPDASEVLQLAARCQHIERWRIPRDSYPMDRSGYLNWRSDLKLMHAERAAGIMRAEGYGEEAIARVGSLLRKERLKRDPESQALEDVICLVFLRHYLAEFTQAHEEEKVIDILAKTWRKMSESGHAAALALPFDEQQAQLIQRALG